MDVWASKKLKLNPDAKASGIVEHVEDSIAVSRPRRTPSVRLRYEDTLTPSINTPTPSRRKDNSSQLSRGIEVVSDERPQDQLHEDVEPRKDYGDFMAYYVAGSSEDEKPHRQTQKRSTAKVPSGGIEQNPLPKKRKAKVVPGSDRRGSHNSETIVVAPPVRPTHQQQHRQNHAQVTQAAQVTVLPAVSGIPVTISGPAAANSIHPMAAQSHYSHSPIHLYEPVINLIDVPLLPALQGPDPLPIMLSKLENLSVALKKFDGSTSAPPSQQAVVDHVEPTSDRNKPPRKAKNGSSKSTTQQSNGLPETESGIEQAEVHTGKPDESLIYGLVFIMNALRSWAEQRIKQEFMQHYAAQHAAALQQGQEIPPSPPLIHAKLAETPEGAAIAAFQDVLRSGCLVVGTLLPMELSQALQKLYLQIDKVINQTPSRPPWQCISYAAQKAAHQARMQEWHEANRLALEALRQQYMTHHHPMPTANGSGTLQHPIDLSEQAHSQVNAFPPYAMPGIPLTRPPQLAGVSMPGYLPRSGQSMNFSFAPQDETAVQVFGRQAFPPGTAANNTSVPDRIPSSSSKQRRRNSDPTGRLKHLNGDKEVINLTSSSPQRPNLTRERAEKTIRVDSKPSKPRRSADKSKEAA